MYKMKIFLQQRQKWSKICGAVGNERGMRGNFFKNENKLESYVK